MIPVLVFTAGAALFAIAAVLHLRPAPSPAAPFMAAVALALCGSAYVVIVLGLAPWGWLGA
jgi:hypothetical protein